VTDSGEKFYHVASRAAYEEIYAQYALVNVYLKLWRIN